MYFARILEYVFYLYLIFVGFAFSNVFLDFDITYLKQLPVYLCQLLLSYSLENIFLKCFSSFIVRSSSPSPTQKKKNEIVTI